MPRSYDRKADLVETWPMADSRALRAATAIKSGAPHRFLSSGEGSATRAGGSHLTLTRMEDGDTCCGAPALYPTRSR
ncbi:hypothetical protein CHELA1G2_14119 [Hyphomicrobiales bacterium]|nr:hypothetical protein CHELA1G2_14119 [Hyphomicrobiales bacterium]